MALCHEKWLVKLEFAFWAGQFFRPPAVISIESCSLFLGCFVSELQEVESNHCEKNTYGSTNNFSLS